MKIFILLLLFMNFYSENKMDMPTYDYKGRILKVVYDNNRNTFNPVNIQLGEMMCFFEIKSFRSSGKNDFQLEGFIQMPIPKNGKLTSNLPNILIFKCLKKGQEFILKDTLSLSDKNGHFSIKTNRNRNEYLIIKQDSIKGVCYDMQKFRKKGRTNL